MFAFQCSSHLFNVALHPIEMFGLQSLVCGQMLLSLIHCPVARGGPWWPGSCGGSKPAGGGGGLGWLGGGGLGQEFISLLIGPFDHFFQFVLEFFGFRKDL